MFASSTKKRYISNMKKKARTSKPKSLKRASSKPNSKVAVFVVIILVVLSGYYVYRSLIALAPQPIQVAEIKNASGTVNLTISSDNLSLAPDQEATITVKYDSPTNKLTVVNGEISYDPAVLTPSNFLKAEGFPTEFVAATATNGKIKFTYGVAVAANSGLTGQGNVMTFKVRSKAVGSTTLSLTDATEVLTTGSDNNALKEITNTTITVADPSATASPSTAASTAASSSPSSNPSTNPSATASPSTEPSTNPSSNPSTTPSTNPSTSPDPTEPAAQKPQSPTNLKYNCYSGGKRITLRWDSVSGVSNYEVVFNQKDGDDKQTKTTTRPEIDLDVRANTTYTWQVVSIKNGVKSDPSTVADIKCSGDVAQSESTPTPTPTPTPAATPTPAPTKKPITQQIANIFKPKSPSPTPTPSTTSTPVPLASFIPSSPISSPGSLADIFATPSTEPEVAAKQDNTSFIAKIFLGWQALFIRLVETLTK